jgi:isoleucyl-tRNA synthetase
VDVIGSFAELTEHIGHALPNDFDPHKPHIDGYSWRCARKGCAGQMRRVPEVIDTWFDSGSMPFAQWHYPFENRERFAAQYPADFIAEGVDQTRGWFYSLLAIATGLELEHAVASGEPSTAPTPAYRAVVVNDQVLDAEGQKMSKSRGNAVDPWEVIKRHGVDAVRLFFVASSNVWVPRRFDERVIREQAGRFLLTFKNIYSGIFAQYANFGWTPSELDPPVERRTPLDRWVIGRLAIVERAVDDALQHYQATDAARAIIDFVDDDLANWYVRLSRSRFYDVEFEDNRAAFATLHEVLVSVCRLLAPIAPFMSDWIHRQLVGTSVHLAPFVAGRVPSSPADAGLQTAMSAVRTLARLGRAAREEAGIKVRQPLSRLVCVAPSVNEVELEPLVMLLKSELNMKHVDFATSADALVSLEAKPIYRSLGKKFGKKTPLAAEAIKAFTSEQLRLFLTGQPLVVTVDGETHALDQEDLTIIRRASGNLVVEEDNGFFAAIDPTVTLELRREGLAREMVSRVQRMRKEAGLAVSDRIALSIGGTDDIRAVVAAHGEWIASEVLATELVFAEELTGRYDAMQELDLDGVTARVAFTRIQ